MMRYVIFPIVVFLNSLIACGPLPVEETSEPYQFVSPLAVIRVYDGDTIVVRRDGWQEFKVRMKGVDSPEMNEGDAAPPEAWAQAAKDFTLTHVGIQVDLEFDSDCAYLDDPYEGCMDQYDRLLAYVRISTGEDLGELLLREGLAKIFRWNNEEYDRLDVYEAAVDEAQAAGKGVW